ncbi:MAG TPA: GntR family transcriptional regulator [Chthoniobacteraceae bacterium]|nr:GntR family transcriptional regulator [Chthoniobacteraceae bacterium]
MTPTLSSRASSPRYLILAQVLARRISNGEYAVGARLPVEKELAQEFDVAVMTVRQGVGLLVKQGLVERRQGLGTFVLRAPTNTANIAILVGDSLTVESAHYYRALVNRLRKGADRRKWDLRHYDEMNREIFPKADAARRAEQVLLDHRNLPFHGVVELVPGKRSIIPAELVERLPSALFEPPTAHTDILGDDETFGCEAARNLVQTGCRRLFFFSTQWEGYPMPGSIDAVLDEAARLGVSAPAVHCLSLSSQGFEAENRIYQEFRQIVQSWKSPANRRKRPDGLIFNDDIALRSAMPALLQEGFSVPEDFKIVCMTNEDAKFCYGAPIIRYEISPRAVANHLLSALDCRMRGVKAPAPMKVTGRVVIEG